MAGEAAKGKNISATGLERKKGPFWITAQTKGPRKTVLSRKFGYEPVAAPSISRWAFNL
jgi:hypothetical protein